MLPITTKVMVYPLCLSVCQYNVTDHNKSHGLPALSLCVSIMLPITTKVMVYPLCLCVSV